MPEEKAIATLDTPVDELEQKLVDETDIDELKNIINLFKNNVKGYLAINDIQEIITCITYLFWNSKYVVKEKFNEFLKYLKENTII